MSSARLWQIIAREPSASDRCGMSEIGKRIASIVDLGLDPYLKEQGFRRRGVNFFRADGDAIQVVTVQSSQWNYGDTGRFRLNFGVHFPAVAEVLGGNKMPQVPKEHYCLLRAIFGFPDLWWKVEPATDERTMAGELTAYCEKLVWPWLQKNQSLAEAAATLEIERFGSNLRVAAAARLVLGERDQAKRLVRKCIADFEKSLETAHPTNVEIVAGHLRAVQEWAASHQLL